MAAIIDPLLDQIFGDDKVKHKLDLFSQQEKGRLQIFKKGQQIRIRCMVRDRDFVAKPEEVVRQLALIHLHYTLDYPLDQLAVEVPVQMGSGVSKKAADVVVYKDPQKIIPYIIIEVKKPGRRDGREQLHSYMNATGAPFGLWTNGGTGTQGVAHELRTDPNLFAELPRLPAQGETLDDVLEPIRKKDLEPAEDLIELVKQMQEEVLANAGVNVFEEVFKLFFIKLWDEENASDNPRDDSSICRFRRTADPPEDQYHRFKHLLDDACRAYPDIFPESTDFDLSPEALLVAVSVLERVRLTDTDLELIDLTFEYLMNPESKGDKGQYFTPRQVVRMAVKMLNPTQNESMLDPACGLCGFPIHTLLHVREHELRPNYADWATRVQRYGRRNLFAVDFDGRVARVAKFMMRLAGDGRANVMRMNSLDKREWRREQQYQREIAQRQFDLIMTNPPFAGTIRHPEILNSYDLGFNETLTRRKSKNDLSINRERKLLTNQTRDVLFLDYCLTKLKPGGRMAIVLPQGNFNNISAEQIRRYVMSRARILAVVGLDVNTFKPHTGTKTSLLFVQRWAGAEADAWAAWYDDLYEYEAALAEYEALIEWREKLLKKKTPQADLPDAIRQPPSHPGDPPAPPSDYPIFFATSRRSGRDNSGRYDYLKDDSGQVVVALRLILAHDEEGRTVEVTRNRPLLNTDLDEIADAFIAWGQEHNLDFFASRPADSPAFAEVVAGADYDVSSVMLSKLGSAYRLDAEHYRPRYLKLDTLLASSSIQPWGTLGGRFIVGPFGSAFTVDNYVDDPTYRYIRGKDVKPFILTDNDNVYMPEEDFIRLQKYKVQVDDLLISVVGTLGNVAIITQDVGKAIYSCKSTLYRSEDDIDPYYLAAYLNSSIGQAYLERNARGAIQMGLNLDDLASIPIYVPTSEQQRVTGDLVRQSFEKQKKSKTLYRQAEQLLLDELGLQDLDLSDELYGEAPLTEVWTIQRFDAEYFQPKYYKLVDQVESTGQDIRLGEWVSEPIRRGVLPDYTTNGGEVVVINSQHVGKTHIELDDNRFTTWEFVKTGTNERALVMPYDVLLNSTGYITIGRCQVLLDNVPTIVDGHISIIRPKSGLDPVYLSLYLNSLPGQLQTERGWTGSSGQIELRAEVINEYVIWKAANSNSNSPACRRCPQCPFSQQTLVRTGQTQS